MTDADEGSTAAAPLYTVPDWAHPNPADASFEGAVFCVAICLKTLDDLIRSQPVWLGCFRARQALVCAHAACQGLRLKTDMGALRDAVLLCGPDGDPGPAGRVYQSIRRLSRRAPVLSAKTVLALTQTLELKPLSDPDLARALCLAFAVAIRQALNSANTIARNASTLQVVAPKLRSKGAQVIIQQLLEEDSLLATAPECGLSRWAAPRLFARLEGFGAVRELSGRPSFKIYGL